MQDLYRLIFFPHIHITYVRHTQAAWGRRSFELVLSLVKMTITTFYSQDCTSIDKLDVNDVTTNTLFMVHTGCSLKIVFFP